MGRCSLVWFVPRTSLTSPWFMPPLWGHLASVLLLRLCKRMRCTRSMATSSLMWICRFLALCRPLMRFLLLLVMHWVSYGLWKCVPELEALELALNMPTLKLMVSWTKIPWLSICCDWWDVVMYTREIWPMMSTFVICICLCRTLFMWWLQVSIVKLLVIRETRLDEHPHFGGPCELTTCSRPKSLSWNAPQELAEIVDCSVRSRTLRTVLDFRCISFFSTLPTGGQHNECAGGPSCILLLGQWWLFLTGLFQVIPWRFAMWFRRGLNGRMWIFSNCTWLSMNSNVICETIQILSVSWTCQVLLQCFCTAMAMPQDRALAFVAWLASVQKDYNYLGCVVLCFPLTLDFAFFIHRRFVFWWVGLRTLLWAQTSEQLFVCLATWRRLCRACGFSDTCGRFLDSFGRRMLWPQLKPWISIRNAFCSCGITFGHLWAPGHLWPCACILLMGLTFSFRKIVISVWKTFFLLSASIWVEDSKFFSLMVVIWCLMMPSCMSEVSMEFALWSALLLRRSFFQHVAWLLVWSPIKVMNIFSSCLLGLCFATLWWDVICQLKHLLGMLLAASGPAMHVCGTVLSSLDFLHLERGLQLMMDSPWTLSPGSLAWQKICIWGLWICEFIFMLPNGSLIAWTSPTLHLERDSCDIGRSVSLTLFVFLPTITGGSWLASFQMVRSPSISLMDFHVWVSPWCTKRSFVGCNISCDARALLPDSTQASPSRFMVHVALWCCSTWGWCLDLSPPRWMMIWKRTMLVFSSLPELWAFIMDFRVLDFNPLRPKLPCDFHSSWLRRGSLLPVRKNARLWAWRKLAPLKFSKP